MWCSAMMYFSALEMWSGYCTINLIWLAEWIGVGSVTDLQSKTFGWLETSQVTFLIILRSLCCYVFSSLAVKMCFICNLVDKCWRQIFFAVLCTVLGRCVYKQDLYSIHGHLPHFFCFISRKLRSSCFAKWAWIMWIRILLSHAQIEAQTFWLALRQKLWGIELFVMFVDIVEASSVWIASNVVQSVCRVHLTPYSKYITQNISNAISPHI